MKLSDVKITKTKQSKATQKTGRVISVSFKGVRVMTDEDRARLEAAAKRPNSRRKYPVMMEA